MNDEGVGGGGGGCGGAEGSLPTLGGATVPPLPKYHSLVLVRWYIHARWEGE